MSWQVFNLFLGDFNYDFDDESFSRRLHYVVSIHYKRNFTRMLIDGSDIAVIKLASSVGIDSYRKKLKICSERFVNAVMKSSEFISCRLLSSVLCVKEKGSFSEVLHLQTRPNSTLNKMKIIKR